ncbi:hypothetical protein SFUMM280S_10523 [Streptomyces fumanus]
MSLTESFRSPARVSRSVESRTYTRELSNAARELAWMGDSPIRMKHSTRASSENSM